jgi:hypothetical protein
MADNQSLNPDQASGEPGGLPPGVLGIRPAAVLSESTATPQVIEDAHATAANAHPLWDLVSEYLAHSAAAEAAIQAPATGGDSHGPELSTAGLSLEQLIAMQIHADNPLESQHSPLQSEAISSMFGESLDIDAGNGFDDSNSIDSNQEFQIEDVLSDPFPDLPQGGEWPNGTPHDITHPMHAFT